MRRMVFLLLPAAALAVPTDSVTYRDPKKQGQETTRTGTITKETPEGIEIKSGTGTQTAEVRDLIVHAHGDVPADYQQAEEAQQCADFVVAADLFRRSLDAKGVGPWIQHEARFRRADCLYRAGDLAGAEAALRELQEKAAEGLHKQQAQLRIGQCLLFKKDFDAARSAFEKLTSSRTEEGVGAVYWSARVLEHRGDLPGAHAAYEDAILRSGATFPVVRDMARARQGICDIASGKAREVLAELTPLAEQASGETAGGAALRNALGRANLALANEAKDKPEEMKKLAFAGFLEFCRVLVYTDPVPEEHAPAYDGARDCLLLLGDARAAQFKDDRKRYYGEAFGQP